MQKIDGNFHRGNLHIVSDCWFGPCINYAWKGRAVVSPSPQLVRQSTNYALKGGYRNFSFSFIGPVEHNVWWENSRNGSFGPKNGPKTQIANF